MIKKFETDFKIKEKWNESKMKKAKLFYLQFGVKLFSWNVTMIGDTQIDQIAFSIENNLWILLD